MLSTRGFRNNNPGNIRRDKDLRWVGAAQVQTDPDFVQYIAPEYGIRAMVKILSTYARLHNADTVQEIISRWAPPSENNTTAYIADVCRYMGGTGKPLDRAEQLDLHDPSIMGALVEAIIHHENRTMPYDLPTIARGVSMGLGRPVTA